MRVQHPVPLRHRTARAAFRAAGFTLLPVMLAMTLIAAIAFLLNRDNGANARMITSHLDMERARYAAEAGLQAVNYQVQQQGCAGGYPTSATPVSNVAFGGGGYSAYADRSTGFPLVLTATGTYNGASITLSRVNVQVFQSPVRATTVQPSPGMGEDTYVNSAAVTRNYGASANLWLWDGHYQALLRFDLSTLPAGSRIVPWYDGAMLQPGAALSLYQTNSPASTGEIGAYLITRGWTEGTGNGSATGDGATWNTYDGVNAWPAGGAYDARPIATVPYVAGLGWYSWDISDAAMAWTGTAYPNYGVWMRVSSGSVNSVQYVSSDDTANPTRRPKIAVNYLAPCSATPQTVTLTLAPTGDAYIDNGSSEYWRNYGGSAALYVYRNGSRQARTLLQFDTSGVPSGSTILSAKLRLYSNGISSASGSSKAISAYAVSESWVEGTKTGSNFPDGTSYIGRDGSTAWTTSGGTYRTPSVAMAVEESSGISPPRWSFRTGWLYWDVKTLVQEWATGTTANAGLILVSTVTDQPTFPSSESGNAAYRPQLVITYQ